MTTLPGGNTTSETIIGLDIGGTKTHGIKIVGGTVVEDRLAGSSNTQNVSIATAALNLSLLLGGLDAANAAHIYAGAGGMDTDNDKAELRRLISPQAPGTNITIVHDTRLILAAAGADTGIAVIAGTGSAAWGVTGDGREARAGGWGYLLGDEGSGYWLGREAVRHSLHRTNLGLPDDELTAGLLDSCGLGSAEELIRLFHGNKDRTYWADKSRLVFDCARRGNPASRKLVDQAGRSLAEQALQVAARLRMQGPVVLGGGLGLNQPALQESFTNYLTNHGITDVQVLGTAPVFGVMHLAEEAVLAAP
ncbi:N-acetylglucosamine kinase [Arthrobacter globiformis]|uniref:N-acetylglucosamine kinase n=1 Tax=Arthrobacter globiformis TaxID=1665 RepID=UPI002789DE65|nr:BadF/BadG/BcrA/BcrD ATPase family protein [Arthrobacter globiformis]MDQ0867254.1 glucosamine kinase [Arthrobacter globiformis]